MKTFRRLPRFSYFLFLLLLPSFLAQAETPSGQGQARPGLLIFDQDGNPVPNGEPQPNVGQTFDVAVGPGGVRVFSPATVNIAVGDTVRWTWQSDFHSVTSGSECGPDEVFCSPSDSDCGNSTLSNTGAVYSHTFTQAGSYTYFCALHCFSGMSGTVNVTGCTPPPSGMDLWLPGDGNTRDDAGGNNGSLQGGATFAAGKVGQAFSLNGTTSFVQVPHNTNLNPAGAFTVDFWINASSQQTFSQLLLVDKSHGWADGTGWGVQTNTSGAPCFFYGTGGNTLDFHGPCGTSGILDDQWHHFAGVFTGTEFRIYLDGVLNTSMSFSVPIVNNTRPVNVGMSWGAGTPTRFFHGLMDEVEFFNRALSATEVAAIFNAGGAGKCKPPQPASAVSRKVHGGAGPFDLNLNPAGPVGVEPRSGGGSNAYQMVVQFAAPVSFSGASVISGSGSVGTSSGAGAAITVDLTGVTNLQRLAVKLSNVNDGTSSGDVPIGMGMLVGDTTGDGIVNAGDTTQTRGRSGQTTDATNFRSDVNTDGTINSGDQFTVRARSGNFLP